jgi:hypothetical protein
MNIHDDAAQTKVSPPPHEVRISSLNPWKHHRAITTFEPSSDAQVKLSQLSDIAMGAFSNSGVIPELVVSPPQPGLQFTWVEDGLRYYRTVGDMRGAKEALKSLANKQLLRLIDIYAYDIRDINTLADTEYKKGDEYKQDVTEFDRLKQKLGK